jgi:hypothetical protein
MRTRALSLLTGLALFGGLSCKSPTEATLTAYYLTSIGGLALPAAYAPNPQQDARMMAAIMILYSDGKGSWNGRSEQSVNGPTYDWSQEFTWKQTGLNISITLECADTASCIAGPHMTGKVSLGRLSFETSNVMRVPFIFQTSLNATP